MRYTGQIFATTYRIHNCLMATILGIGIATLDIINTVANYPAEDSKNRVLNRKISRGGNAANTLVILSQLGHHCAWGGVSTDKPDGQFVLADLHAHGIDTTACRLEPHSEMPTSYILLNQHNGSRTIVHYRDLPEFTFADFQTIDLTHFDWLHCEGRNIADMRHMLQWAHHVKPTLTISVEIEKPRPAIEQLFNEADILLFSRAFAHYCGHDDGLAFLHAMRQQISHARLICAWGSHGAYALDTDNISLYSPACPPPQVVDTLGAGDTFNAGIIHGLCQKNDLATTLHAACRLAGRKCGQIGLTGLGKNHDCH